MNLYVITPDYSPACEMMLAKSDEEALEHAVFVAAHDAVKGDGSPSATVYLVAENLRKVGTRQATDAPAEWAWAHPGVGDNAALIASNYAGVE